MEIPDFLYNSAARVGGRTEIMSQKGTFLRQKESPIYREFFYLPVDEIGGGPFGFGGVPSSRKSLTNKILTLLPVS